MRRTSYESSRPEARDKDTAAITRKLDQVSAAILVVRCVSNKCVDHFQSDIYIKVIVYIWKKSKINICLLERFVFIVSGHIFWQVGRKMELLDDKFCSFWLEHELTGVLYEHVGGPEASETLDLVDIEEPVVISVHFINFLFPLETLQRNKVIWEQKSCILKVFTTEIKLTFSTQRALNARLSFETTAH